MNITYHFITSCSLLWNPSVICRIQLEYLRITSKCFTSVARWSMSMLNGWETNPWSLYSSKNSHQYFFLNCWIPFPYPLPHPHFFVTWRHHCLQIDCLIAQLGPKMKTVEWHCSDLQLAVECSKGKYSAVNNMSLCIYFLIYANYYLLWMSHSPSPSQLWFLSSVS